MTTRNSSVEADRALKAKHRAMWAQGDYPSLAAEVIPGLGAVLVEACGVRSGQRVLDVGAGSGNAAIPAALAGADVVASDLAPELFEAGRRVAEQRGAHLTWQEADAEALPFGDAEFDVVLSCVGVMFAPHHQQAADELVRVCRPGGTIGLLSWTPQGFIGRMFATMKPYAPPPPPGAQPPPLWGDEDHVRALLGDRVTDVRAERRTVRVDRFETPEAFRDYFKERYGPTITVYKNIDGDPERTAALDRGLADLARDGDLGAGGGGTALEWEYLLLTARRAG
ncbi:class I SAM-dependent methyltransferase [Streptomyces coeruleorubidus]|uniref:class I SAM-dependent methyltransferase n=1 Tax=Streptomyces coeruleorubidus TaxID=116188 RepID=UPI0033A6955C